MSSSGLGTFWEGSEFGLERTKGQGETAATFETRRDWLGFRDILALRALQFRPSGGSRLHTVSAGGERWVA